MTELYLAPWRWVLDPDNGDRWEAPLPGSVGCLDLRSVPQFSSLGGTPGPGIFSYPGPVVIPGALQLGNDLAGSLSNPVKAAIRNRLNLPSALSATTLVDVLWELLTTKADPTGLLRCKPLMPTLAGRLGLHLGGFSLIKSKPFSFDEEEGPLALAVYQADYRQVRQERLGDDRVFIVRDNRGNPHPVRFSDTHKRVLSAWVKQFGGDYRRFIPPDLPDEGMLEPFTTLDESFVTGDSDILGPDQTWTEVVGDTDIVSSRAKTIDTVPTNSNRVGADLAGDNHSVKVLCVTLAATRRMGPCARFAAAATTFYAGLTEDDPGISHAHWTISLMSAGTESELATNATGYAAPSSNTLKLSVDGSSLELFQDDVSKVTTTHTGVTGNVRTGFMARKANSIFGAWQAVDLAAAAFDLDRVERYFGRGFGRGFARSMG